MKQLYNLKIFIRNFNEFVFNNILRIAIIAKDSIFHCSFSRTKLEQQP